MARAQANGRSKTLYKSEIICKCSLCSVSRSALCVCAASSFARWPFRSPPNGTEQHWTLIRTHATPQQTHKKKVVKPQTVANITHAAIKIAHLFAKSQSNRIAIFAKVEPCRRRRHSDRQMPFSVTTIENSFRKITFRHFVVAHLFVLRPIEAHNFQFSRTSQNQQQFNQLLTVSTMQCISRSNNCARFFFAFTLFQFNSRTYNVQSLRAQFCIPESIDDRNVIWKTAMLNAQKYNNKKIRQNFYLFAGNFFLALCLSHKTDNMELGVESLRQRHIWLVVRTDSSHRESVCVRSTAASRCRQSKRQLTSSPGDALLWYRSTNRADRSSHRVGALLLCQFGCVCWCGHALAAIRPVSTCHVLGFVVCENCLPIDRFTVSNLVAGVGSVWAAQMWDGEVRWEEKKKPVYCERASVDASAPQTRIACRITRNAGLFESMRAFSTRQKNKTVLSLFFCFLLSAPVISTRGHSTDVPSNRLRAKQQKKTAKKSTAQICTHLMTPLTRKTRVIFDAIVFRCSCDA